MQAGWERALVSPKGPKTTVLGAGGPSPKGTREELISLGSIIAAGRNVLWWHGLILKTGRPQPPKPYRLPLFERLTGPRNHASTVGRIKLPDPTATGLTRAHSSATQSLDKL